MKINSIITLLLLLFQINSLDLSFLNLYNVIKDEIGLNEVLRPLIQSFISSNISNIKNLSLNEACESKLYNTYFITDNYMEKSKKRKIDRGLYYYYKLFFTSSKNRNDLGSPERCENITKRELKTLNLTENLTYFLVLLDNENSYYEELKNNNNENNVFGVCIIDGCEEKDYIKLINFISTFLQNYHINYNDTNDTYNDNNNTKQDEKFNNSINIYQTYNNINISIFYTKNKNVEKQLYIKIFKYMPLIIILIHIFFTIFNSIPKYLYKCMICIFCCQCKGKQKKGNTKIKRVLSKDKGQLVPKDANNNINISSSTLSTNIDKVNEMINLLYNIDKNFEGLIDYNKQNDIVNDSGLSYINGLRGISMIFLLFGNVFIAVYNSPIIEKNINLFFENLKSVLYCVYYFGIKYSPKLLICCSGFTLFYKFVCFLDDKVESEKDIKRQKEEKKQNTEDVNNRNSDISINKQNKNKKNAVNRTYNFNSLVPIKYLGIFFGYQLHKYILYILMMSFFLFSFYEVISFFHGPAPVWDFFNEKIIEPSYKIEKLILLLFGFQGYLLSFIRNDRYNILNYFNLVYQEIFYFIISVILIFIGYKKNLRIDLFCRISIGVLFLARVLYYFISGFVNIRDYFSYKSYGQFYTSLIYNYMYYLLGIYFGMLNYVIQKRYSYLDCKKNKKIYLIHCVKVIEIIKERKGFPIFLNIIFICILVLCTFLQQILLFIFELINISINECMIKYDKNIFVDILMIIDTDIVVLEINIMALFMYLKGNNPISDFINHNFWSIFNTIYFSYILLINPIILYIIYITETKIKFDINNCFLYTFISGILLFIFVSFIYVVFELPYKKAIRYWFTFSEKEIINERFNNIENTFSYNQIENQAELLEDTNSDVEEYIEDEEDEDD